MGCLPKWEPVWRTPWSEMEGRGEASRLLIPCASVSHPGEHTMEKLGSVVLLSQSDVAGLMLYQVCVLHR